MITLRPSLDVDFEGTECMDIYVCIYMRMYFCERVSCLKTSLSSSMVIES